jgi:hypothetical protein
MHHENMAQLCVSVPEVKIAGVPAPRIGDTNCTILVGVTSAPSLPRQDRSNDLSRPSEPVVRSMSGQPGTIAWPIATEAIKKTLFQ